MKIRPALAEDHPALAEIFLRARRDSFTWQDEDHFRLEDFERETEGEVIHVAETGLGEVAGFLSVWEPENFVHHLFIAIEHRGQGAGRALLEDLRARRKGPFRLKCLAANIRALGYYRRFGWIVSAHGMADDQAYLLMEWGKLPPSFERRMAQEDDLGFLWDLHVLTMRDYVERTWGWEHLWQEENFRRFYETRDMEILEVDGQPIGAITVKEEVEQLYLRNIQILPAWQNRGIGTILVEEFIARAQARKLAAKLQVLKVNPAKALYERLGFRLSSKSETHFLMEHALQTQAVPVSSSAT